MDLDFDKISEQPHLLDILLQMEDVLDSLDVYVFENWIKGEVVDGPNVRRYWADFTLKYPYDKMPNPKAAMRLLKHEIRVDFSKGHLDVDKHEMGQFAPEPEDHLSDQPVSDGDIEEGVETPKDDPEKTCWLVKISMPRRLLAQVSSEQLDFYDDDVDVEDVEDAQDMGIDSETAFTSEDDGLPGGDGDPNAAPDDQFGGPPQ